MSSPLSVVLQHKHAGDLAKGLGEMAGGLGTAAKGFGQNLWGTMQENLGHTLAGPSPETKLDPNFKTFVQAGRETQARGNQSYAAAGKQLATGAATTSKGVASALSPISTFLNGIQPNTFL